MAAEPLLFLHGCKLYNKRSIDFHFHHLCTWYIFTKDILIDFGSFPPSTWRKFSKLMCIFVVGSGFWPWALSELVIPNLASDATRHSKLRPGDLMDRETSKY